MSISNPLLPADVVATNRPVEGPTSKSPDRTDVVIVGAGPAGLVAANLLGLCGVKTVLVERDALTSDQPKAEAVGRRVLANPGGCLPESATVMVK